MCCQYLESDENGDICHSNEYEICPNPFNCTAEYDIHGNPLIDETTGLDREVIGGLLY